MSIFKKRVKTIEYTLKLTPDAEKFIELMSLGYEERRARALELLGDKTFDQMLFADYKVRGLYLKGIGPNKYGEDHIENLLKLAIPRKSNPKLLKGEVPKFESHSIG